LSSELKLALQSAVPAASYKRSLTAELAAPGLIALVDFVNFSESSHDLWVSSPIPDATKVRTRDGADHLSELIRSCGLLANVAMLLVVPTE
jgi:hypothetical protein